MERNERSIDLGNEPSFGNDWPTLVFNDMPKAWVLGFDGGPVEVRILGKTQLHTYYATKIEGMDRVKILVTPSNQVYQTAQSAALEGLHVASERMAELADTIQLLTGVVNGVSD